MFSGGFEAAYDADLEKIWEEKMMAFKEREGPKELPKWDPENPKNKQVYDRTRADYDDDEEDDIPVPVFKPPEDFMMTPAPPAREPEPEPEAEEEEVGLRLSFRRPSPAIIITIIILLNKKGRRTSDTDR